MAPTPKDVLLDQATRLDTTPFDFIVIGSGAGGGPLAARLALAGKRVLVIEAGTDPALGGEGADDRQVYAVPAYNAAATEDPVTAWEFSVRHYADDARQKADMKYTPEKDPSASGKPGKGGIFYPRAAALGGCTAHHAMIIIRPNDSDWDEIAEFTEDPSWRSETMQGYFPKIEQCLYYGSYRRYFGMIGGLLLRGLQGIANLVNPRAFLDPNGHGNSGWQPTSFINPIVVAGIARGDRTLLGVLKSVSLTALGSRDQRPGFLRALLSLQLIQFLDPNVRAQDITTRARLSLISIGTDGKQRSGLREWMLKVAKDHPENLVILTGAHVTRLVFDKGEEGRPRAVGVEVRHGEYLYAAATKAAEDTGRTARYFASGEIVVSGGSFNTPQILMLSGIGEKDQLDAHGIPGPRDAAGTEVCEAIDLPGVGRNLQDRYEVSVISQMDKDFSTLNGASFDPDDPEDPLRRQWGKDRSGLYATNGASVAMMLRTDPKKLNPDIFVFGAPAAFRGYYWGWSRQLLWPLMGKDSPVRNLWTWVILKAYTNNNGGTVRLRSADPFDVPDITFHSFDEGPDTDGHDLAALETAVRRMREFNERIKGMQPDIQPGAQRPDGSDALKKWIKDEAWGHHACGTCRMGPPNDPGAVVDSRFRVRGVDGLRIVDASVFNRIPGYFIVTPIFMIAEKAADTILADSTAYPARLEEAEAAAVATRRRAIGLPSEDGKKLPQDCVGLALSGGGIRSATYALGFLQSLAQSGTLKHVDYLSTVSGGGYIGGFLGRLYTRLRPEERDKDARIRASLGNPNTPEVWWLRRHANYLAGAGVSDLQTNLAVVVRNLFAVQFYVGVLLLFVLGGLHWLSDRLWPDDPAFVLMGLAISPWWRVGVLILLVGVLPLASAYWLTQSARGKGPYDTVAVLLWITLLAVGIATAGMPGMTLWGLLLVGVLLLAWMWQEVVTWFRPHSVPAEERADLQHLSDRDRTEVRFSALDRSRLSRLLGGFLLVFLGVTGFVVIDSVAQFAATRGWARLSMTLALLAGAPFIPFLRNLTMSLAKSLGEVAPDQLGAAQVKMALLSFGVAGALFFALDTAAHAAFVPGPQVGQWVVIVALLVSLAVGQGLQFLNRSSLQQLYSSKLARTFLGASNPVRVRPVGTDAPVPVQVPDARDDVWFCNYHPEASGGPLHLVNVTVNQTVDHISQRQLSQNKGEAMCVGPAGISVGVRFHAMWTRRHKDTPMSKSEVEALPAVPDPNHFHVLARKDGPTAEVEQLGLSHWLAISAAAFTTGSGRDSSLPKALLLGLLNVRLGYWWDSGIASAKRPGLYPPGLWRRVLMLPRRLFTVQSKLLDEFRGRFRGPSARLWYLSDGGHFENLGLYELIRRKLPVMIAVDATRDTRYDLDSIATLMRQIRLDFAAEIDWLVPGRVAPGGDPWSGLDSAAGTTPIPDRVKALVRNPAAIGSLETITRQGPACAALGRITYAGSDRVSWLLLVKTSLAAGGQIDIRTYARSNEAFPNDSTLDQFFDDNQWESYRALGQATGRALFG